MTSEDAVRICRQFANNAPGQRFVWTCECSEALRYAWDGSDAARRSESVSYTHLDVYKRQAFMSGHELPPGITAFSLLPPGMPPATS